MSKSKIPFRVSPNLTTAKDGGSAENAGAIFCSHELERIIAVNVAKVLGAC